MKLTVRIYDNDDIAKCIKKNNNQIFSLENIFGHGGLTKYNTYGIGEYKYRDITFNEIKSLNVDFNYIIENVTIGDIIQKHIRYLRRKKLKEIERKLY